MQYDKTTSRGISAASFKIKMFRLKIFVQAGAKKISRPKAGDIKN
jgi:hypothetical protein